MKLLGRIGTGDANDRSTVEVDVADVLDVEQPDVVDVPLHDPLETVANPEDLDGREGRADRRRGDDAVDPRRWSAAAQDRQAIVPSHVTRSSTLPSRNNRTQDIRHLGLA